MGKRISKVYTRTGDNGTTGMADGSRVAKNSPRMQAIGSIDELNAAIGVLRAEELPEQAEVCLRQIQNELFAFGGELSMPEFKSITQECVQWLEQEIDKMNAKLPALEEFILPAGDRAVSVCHQARTVCRRAERELVALREGQQVRTELMRYINRLSDYLFVLARYIAHENGCDEVYWQK